ncbi:hypothetical protein PACTADRAFT_51968 [Pachysolen tannophilus NRRL Y-2460]|uniref:Ubiquitin-related modifier 1 n=1 Tax=Pachysolen tannophilus NRRL Y-2460 TaxID=669874 RepID=A0A1E4TNR8_PACTA|nr:hypothetical protein PACTADRAFT_51968 [Pachysolen tannophilus NRRL Y-2460]
MSRGGLDQNFNGIKTKQLTVQKESSPILFKDLINHIVENYISNKKDLETFIEEDTIRPGILVLINDTDWELEGKEDYELENGDLITFTSTLHGG